jgi:hypothetical protein
MLFHRITENSDEESRVNCTLRDASPLRGLHRKRKYNEPDDDDDDDIEYNEVTYYSSFKRICIISRVNRMKKKLKIGSQTESHQSVDSYDSDKIIDCEEVKELQEDINDLEQSAKLAHEDNLLLQAQVIRLQKELASYQQKLSRWNRKIHKSAPRAQSWLIYIGAWRVTNTSDSHVVGSLTDAIDRTQNMIEAVEDSQMISCHKIWLETLSEWNPEYLADTNYQEPDSNAT